MSYCLPRHLRYICATCNLDYTYQFYDGKTCARFYNTLGLWCEVYKIMATVKFPYEKSKDTFICENCLTSRDLLYKNHDKILEWS